MALAFSSFSIKAPAKSRSRAWWLKAALVVLAILAGGEGARVLGRDYRLELDLQEIPCLPARVWVVSLDRPMTFSVGDVVAFKTDQAAPYFKPNELMGKRVAALPGDRYAVVGHQFFINGAPRARLTLCDDKPVARYCADRAGAVGQNEVLLLADHPLSFDGRYWGPLATTQIIGRIVWPDLRAEDS